jgi:large subunit ribosomal protein L18
MNRYKQKAGKRLRRKARTKIKIHGTSECPRLTIFRSLQHIYVQAIDDAAGITLASSSTMDKELHTTVAKHGNKDAVFQVGKLIGARLVNKGVTAAVFDKSGYKYHGRVKSLAEGARSAGLKF